MRRRKLLVWLAGLAFAAFSGKHLWTVRVRLENFELVRTGMNRAEVYSLLGSPDDEWFGTTGEQWRCDETQLVVCFDPAGRVLCTLSGQDRPPALKLFDWVGLHWQKLFQK